MAADANADCCILTHISQRYDGVLDVNDVLVAFDGLRVRASAVSTLCMRVAKCERAVVENAKARREARKLRRWDDHDAPNRPDVRGTTVAPPKPSDALENALRAFYASTRPEGEGRAADRGGLPPRLRGDGRPLFRKYGARLQPAGRVVVGHESSDDEAEAVIGFSGGFAALAAGCGDLPARPVFS